MSLWRCGIDGCEGVTDDVEAVLAHQYWDHAPHECAVCGVVVPAGFFAIRHAFDEHSRAEFVRHYEGTSDDIRERERLLREIEAQIDIDALTERLERDDGDTRARADG